MTDQANTVTPAQNNTQAVGTPAESSNSGSGGVVVGAEGSNQTDTQQSVNENLSAQEESTRQSEATNQIPNRTEAEEAAKKVETEEKGIFNDALADQVADATEKPVVDGEASAEAKLAKAKPVEYTDFKLPEGVNLNEGAMKDFIPMAKSANLTQEQAQEFVNMGGRLAEESIALQESAHKQQTSEWQKTSYNHPELGDGKREQYKEAMGFADKAMRAFGDKELAQTLVDTGLVHHPSLLLYFKKAGLAISEDRLVTGQKGMNTKADLFRKMYPASQHTDM